MSDLIIIGKILRPHGIKGEFLVTLYDKKSKIIYQIKKLYYKRDSDQLNILTIESIKQSGKSIIIKAQEVNNRNKAINLQGTEFLIFKELLPSLKENEYYHHDIIGASVFTEAGKYIGEVTSIITTNIDIFVIQCEGKDDILIPSIEDVIKEIDIANKRIVISPMEGLLE